MARFLTQSGALFQHIPRTGGTFVEQVIDALGIECNRWTSKQPKRCPKKHSLFFHYRHDVKPQIKFVFAFVRHPVDYYVSSWRYLCESRGYSHYRLSLLWKKWDWHPFRQAAMLFKPDFAEWCDAVLEREPAWATRLFGWYVGPEHGEFCNYIGRTETLREDLEEVLKSLGVEGDWSMLRKTPGANKSEVPLPDVPPDLFSQIMREERVLIRRFYSPTTAARRWFGTGSA